MALKIAGMASIRFNGRSYDSTGEFTVRMGGSKKDPITLASGKTHFTETLTPGMISGSIVTLPGLNITDIKNAVNAVVQIQAKSGHVYIMKDAFFSAEGEIDPMAAKFSLEFTGAPVKVVN